MDLHCLCCRLPTRKKYLYINGHLETISEGLINDRTHKSFITIGFAHASGHPGPAHPFYRDSYFQGKIDDIWIYNIALSPEDISRHHETTVAVNPLGKITSTWASLKTIKTE
ncbi:LamG domain-containing protein [Candidatus Poribacteria bacterium]|nr:LamG domain-containing protein [Candidatus Poribacteria bacterium]